jgi:hypothetical protein
MTRSYANNNAAIYTNIILVIGTLKILRHLIMCASLIKIPKWSFAGSRSFGRVEKTPTDREICMN